MVARRTFLTAAAIALVLPRPAQAAEPVRVGDVNSYTRMAAFTEPYRKGMQLAVEQVNGKSGAGGRPLELLSRDDAGEPGEAVRVAEEMLARDRVGLLSGGFFSNVGLALASLA